jgi:hypothetical protein
MDRMDTRPASPADIGIIEPDAADAAPTTADGINRYN